MKSTPLSVMAMTGVRRTEWIRLKACGSIQSRPMENATRDEAMTVALSALSVANSPPASTRTTPNVGMKLWAASTIPSSPYSPSSAHVGSPSAGGTAPRHTKTTRR